MTGTVLDELLCSYQGLPKGVNYLVIGDPGVGKTTIILDLLSNIRKQHPGVRVLFVSAEMNENDNRRTMLQGEAVHFLRCPRDIKT